MIELKIDESWSFGITPNYLATLVLAGLKTATCSSKISYEFDQESIPQKDQIHLIVDSDNIPIIAIKLTTVECVPFGKISETFIQAEGEGDYHYWRESHQQFFNAEINQTFSQPYSLHGVKNHKITDKFELICEHFNVIKIFPKTYQQWLRFAEQTLLERAIQDPFLNPKIDAHILLQFVTKRTKSVILAFSETLLNEAQLHQLALLLARRAKGEPMAYILGEKEFWSLPLAVSPATLIPRPDTERLVEVTLELARKRLKSHSILHILDLGTGTGAIALALANELGTQAKVVGVDKLPEAVRLAEHNRQKLGLTNITFLQSHWFANLNTQQFDLIVSNPPYIDQNDENLTQGDVRFEPLSALVATENGLADLRTIIEQAMHYLTPKGALIVEHGWQQAKSVQEIFQQNRWINIQTLQDYAGQDRVTRAEQI